MDYQPEDIPEYLVKQIETALRKGERVYADAEWLRHTIGRGIGRETLEAAAAKRRISDERFMEALNELKQHVDLRRDDAHGLIRILGER